MSLEELAELEAPAEVARRRWSSQLDAHFAPFARTRAAELEAKAARAVKESAELRAIQIAAGAELVDPINLGDWYLGRARALRVPLSARVAGCEARSVLVACGCGKREVRVKCLLRWLCPACRRRTYARMRSRASRALKAHRHASREAWIAGGRRKGAERRVVFATLTVRHSGDLTADREKVRRGFELLRKWLHHRCGKFVYILVWEVTVGRDGLGHVHAHVVALLPQIDWGDISAQWRRGTEGASSHISLKAEGRARSIKDAAHYVAKYSSKGFDPLEMPPELAAKVLAMQYGRRISSTSRGFWRPAVTRRPGDACRHCGQHVAVREYPPHLPGRIPVWVTHAVCTLEEKEHAETPLPSWVRVLRGDERRTGPEPARLY